MRVRVRVRVGSRRRGRMKLGVASLWCERLSEVRGRGEAEESAEHELEER